MFGLILDASVADVKPLDALGEALLVALHLSRCFRTTSRRIFNWE